jgi:hypothetical protein
MKPDSRHANPSYDQHLRSPRFAAVRKEAFSRDMYACRKCGSSDTLQGAHTTYKNFGHETVNDIVTLCAQCHQQVTFLEKTFPGRERASIALEFINGCPVSELKVDIVGRFGTGTDRKNFWYHGGRGHGSLCVGLGALSPWNKEIFEPHTYAQLVNIPIPKWRSVEYDVPDARPLTIRVVSKEGKRQFRYVDQNGLTGLMRVDFGSRYPVALDDLPERSPELADAIGHVVHENSSRQGTLL